MVLTDNPHRQFAEYFGDNRLKPYLYLLSKGLSAGSICIDLQHPDQIALEEEGLNLTDAGKINWNSDLVSDGSRYTPFVVSHHKMYLQRYFQYETIVLKKIRDLIAEEQTAERLRLLLEEKEFVAQSFTGGPAGEVDWQLVAAVSAVLNNFTIITGGPGTGKTHTVARILGLFHKLNPEIKVALAAPTGKAAQRMWESLNNEGQKTNLKEWFESFTPSTLHRLLGSQRNSIYFKHNAENPLSFDLILIDESSMVDMALFAKFLEAVDATQTRVILLGDRNQLASVDAGSLFGDLCLTQQPNSFTTERFDSINQFIPSDKIKMEADHVTQNLHPLLNHIVELEHSWRFDKDKGIGILSRSIIENKPEILKNLIQTPDEMVAIDLHYDAQKFKDFVAGYRAYIEEQDIAQALEKLNRLKVLCAIRKGEFGLNQMNQRIEKLFQKSGLLQVRGEFYENRPIIITSNNYELGLFNGDIGIVRKDETGKLKVWFKANDEAEQSGLKAVNPAFIEDCETVFAMTIHKSQGSEFDKVLILLPPIEDLPLLTRELLYTGVTRAKKSVLIQSEEQTLLQTLQREVKRGSGIRERFGNE